jgi:hypothetical protein
MDVALAEIRVVREGDLAGIADAEVLKRRAAAGDGAMLGRVAMELLARPRQLVRVDDELGAGRHAAGRRRDAIPILGARAVIAPRRFRGDLARAAGENEGKEKNPHGRSVAPEQRLAGSTV